MVEVAQDQSFPWIQQLSVFLPNRVGSLERIIQLLDDKQILVCGFSILDSHDHAVVRLVVDRPEKALDALRDQNRTPVLTQLIGVSVPARAGALTGLLHRLLQAEINAHYAYALLASHDDNAIVALHADDPAEAAATLRRGGFTLVSQRDLEES